MSGFFVDYFLLPDIFISLGLAFLAVELAFRLLATAKIAPAAFLLTPSFLLILAAAALNPGCVVFFMVNFLL